MADSTVNTDKSGSVDASKDYAAQGAGQIGDLKGYQQGITDQEVDYTKFTLLQKMIQKLLGQMAA